jgi:hypothetical protein
MLKGVLRLFALFCCLALTTVIPLDLAVSDEVSTCHSLHAELVSQDERRHDAEFSPAENSRANFQQWPLKIRLAAGQSAADPILDPLTNEHIKPERRLYMREGDAPANQGEAAVAESWVNGQVIQREILEAVYVKSVKRYKLKMDLERFDANGKKLEENEETRRQKGKCRQCHMIDINTGRLYATDVQARAPDQGRMLLDIYRRGRNRTQRTTQ